MLLLRASIGFRICDDPPIVVVDSPGIMSPSFEKTAKGIGIGLKLALTGAIKDNIIGKRFILDKVSLSVFLD
jgi:ribosome biogenesis GTPase A